MTEKDLIKQLKDLQRVRVDQNWKEKTQNILWQKVSETDFNYSSIASLKEKLYSRFFALAKIISPKRLKQIPQPVIITGTVFFVLLGGIVTVGATEEIRPDSPLYFARIVKEKAHLAATLNEDKKNELGIKFASNHAKDISEILSSEDIQTKTPEQIEKLSQSFEENIKSVKIGLEEREGRDNEREAEEERGEKEEGQEPSDSSENKIAQLDLDGNEVEDSKSEVEDNNQEGLVSQSDQDEATNDDQDQAQDATEEEFFGVDSSQEDQGVQIHESPTKPSQEETESGQEEIDKIGEEVSEKLENAEEIIESKKYQQANLINLITKAEDLFDQKKYTQVIETLDEFMRIINSHESEEAETEANQEVGGVLEKATSTENSQDNQEEIASSTEEE